MANKAFADWFADFLSGMAGERFGGMMYDAAKDWEPIDVNERTPEYYKYGGGGIYGVDEEKTRALEDTIAPDVRYQHLQNRERNPLSTSGIIDRSAGAQENEALRQDMLRFASEAMAESPEDEQYRKFLEGFIEAYDTDVGGFRGNFGRTLYDDEMY